MATSGTSASLASLAEVCRSVAREATARSTGNGAIVPVCATVGLAAALAPIIFLHQRLLNYGYDGVVYVGSSVQLANGAVPYRDFVLVHPPGVVLLLLPIALLSRLIGIPAVFGAANLLTIVVVAANCGLVARLMRPRSAPGALVGGLTLALFPGLFFDDQTTKLEPFMMGALLLGLILLYPDARRPQRRRALAAGVAMGFSIAIKLWAIFPVAVVLIVVAVCGRGVAPRFARGLALGVGLPLAPFVLAAPGSFAHDVATSQLFRGLSLIGSFGDAGRLRYLAMYSFGDFAHFEVVATVVVAVVAGTLVAAGRRATPLDWTAAIGLLASVTALLVPVEFYSYYSYFPEVLLAIAAATTTALVCEETGRRAGPRLTNSLRTFGPPVGLAILLVVGAVLATGALAMDRHMMPAEAVRVPVAGIQRVIPAGSCVVTNNLYFVFLANRYLSNERNCPTMVDPYGTWLAANPLYPPPNPPWHVPGLESQWRSWFAASQYAVMVDSNRDFIPWTAGLSQWFSAHFRLRARFSNVAVFLRVASP